MRRHRRVLLGAVLALSFAGTAHATVFLPTDLTDLVSGARTIVYGQVRELRPVLVEGRQRIETLVTLEVQTAIKGDPGRAVTFRVPGGEVGRYRAFMVGAPTFEVDEEVVVFLAGAAPALPYLVGLSQGVLRVAHDARSGAPVVMALPILTVSTPQRVVRGDPARRPAALEEFLDDVRTMVGRLSNPSLRRPAGSSPGPPTRQPRWGGSPGPPTRQPRWGGSQ